MDKITISPPKSLPASPHLNTQDINLYNQEITEELDHDGISSSNNDISPMNSSSNERLSTTTNITDRLNNNSFIPNLLMPTNLLPSTILQKNHYHKISNMDTAAIICKHELMVYQESVNASASSRDLENDIRSVDDTASDSSSSNSDRTTLPDRFDMVLNESGMEYSGPWEVNRIFDKFDNEDDGDEDERLIDSIVLPYPPGYITQKLYTSKFLTKFLKETECTDIKPEEPKFDEITKERKYDYEKALHFAIGPSSTHCYSIDTILNWNNEEFINIVNETKTPDVPHGKDFITVTRYFYKWEDDSNCKIKIFCKVKWLKNFWGQGLFEKNIIKGQKEAAKNFFDCAIRYLKEENVERKAKEEKDEDIIKNINKVKEAQTIILDEKRQDLYEKITTKTSTTTTNKRGGNTLFDTFTSKEYLFLNLAILLIILCFIIIYQNLKIMKAINEFNNDNGIAFDSIYH